MLSLLNISIKNRLKIPKRESEAVNTRIANITEK
jgi:hypothetical protein